MDNQIKYFEANKQLWNRRTMIHKDSAFYDVEGFKKGDSSLKSIELNGVGDVEGKTMLHLQCHFGMDSLSFSRLGATVTGVDFSEEAISEARKLNEELKLDADFICSNVYDLHPGSGESPIPGLAASFDIVFTSYGVIGWLPDLDKWAAIIAHYLKPGGFFYMAEFHPVVWMFDDEFKFIQYSYGNAGVIEIDSTGTYTDRHAAINAKEYSWNHSISEVINALIKHGLQIDFFDEYLYSPYNCFSNTVEDGQGNFYIKGMENKIPMVYSIKATKN